MAQLPDYPPDASVWSAIDVQLNKDDLISHLSTYNPPISVWHNLEKQLETDLKNGKNAVYTEGGFFELKIKNEALKPVENNVRETLKVSRTSQLERIKKRGLLRYLSFHKWAIAATIAGLIFTVFSLLKQQSREGVDLKYSTEVVDNQLLKNTTDDAEADYQLVENFCKHAIAACETPAFKTLKTELDELNAARDAIKNAIGNYNSDADLMMQLRDIEQQRATVLRQIFLMVNG